MQIMLNEKLAHVAVIGAAGKLGSGIALLLLQEMARSAAEIKGRIQGEIQLVVIDTNEKSLIERCVYWKKQLTRYAEKNVIALRHYFREDDALIENAEITNAFVEGAMSSLKISSDLNMAKEAKLIFEAVLEDMDLKTKIFTQLKKICSADALFFSNTSSIPISILNSRSGLYEHIFGFHFYNPPAVQELLEFVPPAHAAESFINLAMELARRLNKTVVTAKDVAGFVGNGHFFREVVFALEELKAFQNKSALKDFETLYCLDRMTRDFLIRPMGLFQLLDYIGINIGQAILKIMETNLPLEKFHYSLIIEMVHRNVCGGQQADGSQKDGFFQYEKNNISGVYSLAQKSYVPLSAGDWVRRCEEKMGPLPAGHIPWKKLIKQENKEGVLKTYFKDLFSQQTLAARQAQQYLVHSRKVADELVKKGIARTQQDINLVLQKGFAHAYGPFNDYY